MFEPPGVSMCYQVCINVRECGCVECVNGSLVCVPVYVCVCECVSMSVSVSVCVRGECESVYK